MLEMKSKRLAKEITEPHRTGGRYSAKGKAGQLVKPTLDPDYDYVKARPNRTKSQSDNLAPLEGFLRKNIGRPWSKVFSDLVKRLEGDGEMHRNHVMTHLNHMVELNTVFNDKGAICYPPHRVWSKNREEIDGYYVHPTTGLLCFKQPVYYSTRWRQEKKKKELEPKTEFRVQPFVYRMENGCWFRMEWDGKVEVIWVNGKRLEAIKTWNKKQLNKKELEEFYLEFPTAKRHKV